MAQGALTLFEEFSGTIGDGTHDLDNDTHKLALLTNATVPTAADTTPNLSDYTEVSGSGYTAGGASLTTTWTEAAGVATFDATGDPAASWTQDGSGPTNIYYGLIYETGAGAGIGFVDMTADGGTTPISLQNGNITWTPNVSGIFTLS